MKKSKSILAILFLLISISTQSGFGQKLYFKAVLGGGFGFNGSAYRINSYTYTDTTSFIKKSNVKFLSFGNGIYPGIAIGLNIGKNISFEININYIKRIPIKIHTINNYSRAGQNFPTEWQYKFDGHSFSLTPAFAISCGFEKFNPYFKMGFIIAKGSLKEEDSISITNSYYPQKSYIQKLTHYTDLYYGFKSAMGFEYAISKKTKIYFEVAYDNIALKPSKTTLTEYTTNGTSLMGQLNIMDKEIIYVDEISPNTQPDPNKPLPVLKEKLNFDALIINVGFKFSL